MVYLDLTEYGYCTNIYFLAKKKSKDKKLENL